MGVWARAPLDVEVSKVPKSSEVLGLKNRWAEPVPTPILHYTGLAVPEHFLLERPVVPSVGFKAH